MRKARSKGRTAAKKATTKYLSFPCVEVHQGETKFYMFQCKADVLWGIVEINRRAEDKDEGYQRALSASRVKQISRFILAGGLIPNSIIVSFDSAAFSRKSGLLRVPNQRDAGWVIDGQHRLAGAHKSAAAIELPVIGFLDITEEEQIDLFITINREQKGVSPSLYYDLLKKLPRKLSEPEVVKERASDLANALRSDAKSPFYRRIVVTSSPKKGELSMVNVVRKLEPHIRPQGRLANVSDEIRVGLISNIYSALGLVFAAEFQRTDSVFFRTIGFGAIINNLPALADLALSYGKDWRQVTFVKLFKAIDYFDFAGWRQMGTGTQAENQAASDFRDELEKSVPDAQPSI